MCDQWDVAIATKGELITGVWPYPVENKMGVSILRSPVLTPYLGPHVFYPAGLKDTKLDGFAHDAMAELLKQLPPVKVWHLAVQPGLQQVGLFRSHDLENSVQQTFLINLLDSEEQIVANMSESRRRQVRQADKDLEIFEDKKYLPQLFSFHQQTLEGKGRTLPYALADLTRAMKACASHDAAALWVAREGGVVQAIVWQVWDAHCSYYLMGSQNPEGSGYKAMSVLLWHAMKEAKRKGHRTFDLEGSMDPGVERYFRGFGGTRTLYLVLRKNESLLWKMKNMIFK